MPARYIVAVADANDLATVVARLGNQSAGIAYKRDDDTLNLLDPDTGNFLALPLAALIALTTGAQATGGVVTAPKVAYARYDFAVDGGGAPGLITPATNSTIPANAIITSVIINSTTAVNGSSSTVSIGLSAGGGGAAALLAATGQASFSTDAKLAGVPIPNDATKWIKMSAAGVITLTSAVAALTAGVIEIFVTYYVTKNS